MSDLRARVEALRKLRDAATPGPWRWQAFSDEPGRRTIIGKPTSGAPLGQGFAKTCGLGEKLDSANAALIAAAPEAVSLCEELLARLQEAEAAIDQARRWIDRDRSYYLGLDSALDDYRAAHPKEASADTYCTCGGKPIVAGTTTHYIVCAECGKPKEE